MGLGVWRGVLPYFGHLQMCGHYGWVFEKVCNYDGCFWEHFSTYHGYLCGNFTSTWGKKGTFSFKMTQFFTIYGWGHNLSWFATQGTCVTGRTTIPISWASIYTFTRLEMVRFGLFILILIFDFFILYRFDYQNFDFRFPILDFSIFIKTNYKTKWVHTLLCTFTMTASISLLLNNIR